MRSLIAAAVLLLAGCGNDLAPVSCSSGSDCILPSMSLFLSRVECCGGSCVLASVGCDSGWRYLTMEPGYGECVAASVCAPLDMSLPPIGHD
jgi:hypothetical protein